MLPRFEPFFLASGRGSEGVAVVRGRDEEGEDDNVRWFEKGIKRSSWNFWLQLGSCCKSSVVAKDEILCKGTGLLGYFTKEENRADFRGSLIDARQQTKFMEQCVLRLEIRGRARF